jgi:predicted lipoprotein with Yx(FWY)xxD motif
VTTRKVGKLGVILVNSAGRTLYMFVPDKQKKVTCKGSCAVIWPPLKIKAGHKPTAGGAAKKSLLGTDKNPSGGLVVTYNRWPLYTYITDHKPGQATGQGVNNSGGLWYVLSPSGKVIKTKK